MTVYFPLGAQVSPGRYDLLGPSKGSVVCDNDGVCTSRSHLQTFNLPLPMAHYLWQHGPMQHLATVEITETEFDFRFYIHGACSPRRTTALRILSWVPPDAWPALLTGKFSLSKYCYMWFEAGLRHKTGGMPAVRTREGREWRVNGAAVCTSKCIINHDAAFASIVAASTSSAAYFGRASAPEVPAVTTSHHEVGVSSSYAWKHSVYPCKLATFMKVWPLLDEDGVKIQLPAATLAAIDSMLRTEVRAGAVRLYSASPTLRAVLDYI